MQKKQKKKPPKKQKKQRTFPIHQQRKFQKSNKFAKFDNLKRKKIFINEWNVYKNISVLMKNTCIIKLQFPVV